jgi:hypothetical protein
MNDQAGKDQAQNSSAQPTTGARDPDAIYQRNKIVARVSDLEIDLEAKELRMGEIYNSDEFMIPEECEFRQYRILVQRIAYATKIDRAEIHKGRILKGVTADILGYLEQ